MERFWFKEELSSDSLMSTFKGDDSPEPGPLLYVKIKGRDAVSDAISVAFQDPKAKTLTLKVTVQKSKLDEA
ncbi:hypothetical protein VNO77_23008 [Canavalia gladiata]|uniref:Uncharacterized protein n=1 Tax=Canavalia gladiata TaxID=3824 RepID=A0AAN9QF02_CANGL